MNTTIEAKAEEALDALLREMKRTKGARFNASKRLEDRASKRTANTAYASAAVVVLTLLPIFFAVPTTIAAAINLTTIAFSIFILASSLLQSAHGDPVKADQFQRCALEINSLRRDLRGLEVITVQSVRDYATRFDDILRRYNINHDEVDYEKYRLDHPDEFPQFAAEDTALARKDVKSQNAGSENFAKLIAVATMGLVLASTALPFADAIVRFVRSIRF